MPTSTLDHAAEYEETAVICSAAVEPPKARLRLDENSNTYCTAVVTWRGAFGATKTHSPIAH